MGQRSSSIGAVQPKQNIISQQKIPSTQRETTGVTEPKVMSCSFKNKAVAPRFDHQQQIQQILTNLKQSQTGLVLSNSGALPAKQYARSTSRGKEGVPSSIAQVNKLTALLGKPIGVLGRNGTVGASASSGAVGTGQGVAMNVFHPRPQNLRVKKSTNTDITTAQIVSSTQRSGSFSKV